MPLPLWIIDAGKRGLKPFACGIPCHEGLPLLIGTGGNCRAIFIVPSSPPLNHRPLFSRGTPVQSV